MICFLLAWLALPTWTAAPDAEVLLRTRRFVGSQPERAVADFLRDLRAQRPAAGGSGELTAVRTVAFYDTPDSCVLRSRGLYLRLEASGEAGPSEAPRLFATGDGLAPAAPLAVVNDLTITENVFSVTWDDGAGDVRLEVVLWYTEPPTRPLVARAVVRGAGAGEVVAAVRALARWVEPEETTAMEIVYRGFCAAPAADAGMLRAFRPGAAILPSWRFHCPENRNATSRRGRSASSGRSSSRTAAG
jgi:hypothetical protein